MEIQKIFSNVEDPEENLYSIIMSEEELSLFSEFQKEFNSKAQKALRHRLEVEKGKGIIERNSKGFIPDDKRFYKRVARRINKSSIKDEKTLYDNKRLTRPELLNTSINDKALFSGPVASSEPLNNELIHTRGIKKRRMRKLPEYDHSKTNIDLNKHFMQIHEMKRSKQSGITNLIKKNKKALEIGGGLAAAGGIGYGIHKYRQNKEKE